MTVGLARWGPCDVPRHPALSVEELVAVMQRFDAYQQAPDGTMELTALELAMLLEEEETIPFYLELHDRRVAGRMAWPSAVRCWPIAFAGALEVSEGELFFTPGSLQIGKLELGRWFEGRRMRVPARALPSARLRSLVEQTRRAEVRAGKLQIELYEPRGFHL